MKKRLQDLSSVILAAALFVCLSSAGLRAEPIVFNDNGVWCWFQDERAIVHNGKLIIGSVADASGTGGAARDGNVEVVYYDIVARGPAIRTVLHANYNSDDHAAPAFLALPDNRILTMYSRHGGDNLIRYRITSYPDDATVWDPEMTISRDAGVTYSNVYRLSAENGGSGRIYDFYRGENYNPNFVTSDDNGQTWTYGLPGVSTDGRLIAIGTGGTRPYVKYTSNAVDKIHFITTEAHPRDYPNSIYYGCLYQGNLYAADGTWLHDTASGGIAPQSLEKIYQGGVNNVAWTTDIDLDAGGNPYFAFSVQMNQDMNDLRYWYARWDGSQWHVHEMAYAGSALYAAESDYTGLVALDPNNPDIVYISADVHPVTGVPLISSADGQRHYELFRGTTADMGAAWQWEYITKNSTRDNIRPIIPKWNGGTILLWCRGTYWSYTSWDLDVVGLFDPQPITSDEPEITDQPDSTAALIGGDATFTVQAAGLAPLNYAWYKVNDGGDIPVGGNTNKLVLTNIQISDLGQYYCVITNTAGSVSTNLAGLMKAHLSAYWPMEGNYNDVTGNGYDASGMGSPVFDTGVFSGQAVSLGGGSYLNCADSSDLTLKDGGTVSAWIKTSALNTALASVISKGQLSWRLLGSGDTSAVSFYLNSPSSEYQAQGDIPVVDGTWHHLVATYDVQSIRLYVDGLLDAEVSTPEPVNEVTDSVYIGSQLVASGTSFYVDAEGGSGGNTARAGDGDVDAWWTAAITADGLWQRRTIYGNDSDYTLGNSGSDIFESTGTVGAEDVVQVVTTISGLTPGTMYKVDVVYWSAAGQNWSIQAGFDADTLLYYDRLGMDGAAAGTPTGKTEADRSEYTGLVGYTQADANGEIKVFVDDKPGGGTSYYDRCWYDGLLVENVSGGSSPGMFWEGLIDEVRIYSFAMDAQTIRLLYEQNRSCYQLDPYDRNEDCRISLDDLDLFLGSWLDDGRDPQTQVCAANPGLDITGSEGMPDCKVDLYEFADMAFRWLDCTLLPTSDCP